MLQLIKFFTNNRVFWLFVILELIAFVFIIKSHSFHQSRYLNTANSISGGILTKSTKISDYFNLSQQNKILVEENKLLLNRLEKANQELNLKNITEIDSLSKYQHIYAKVIDNPYHKRNNTLTINKGSNDGIAPNMGVIVPNGIIGITLRTSKHFTIVMSLLNSQSKINAKMKKSHHFGSLEWNGEHFDTVQFTDLPIQANIKKGDTIISGGKSVFFPEGIPIGTISDFTIKDKTYETIHINLFTDMSALNYVYVVKNNLGVEQLKLESESKHE